MSQFTVENLVSMGYSEAMAKSFCAMSPLDRLACLPICGNAWQDMPLFETIRVVLEGAYGSGFKKQALIRSFMVVGEPVPEYLLGVGVSEDTIANEVKKYNQE